MCGAKQAARVRIPDCCKVVHIVRHEALSIAGAWSTWSVCVQVPCLTSSAYGAPWRMHAAVAAAPLNLEGPLWGGMGAGKAGAGWQMLMPVHECVSASMSLLHFMRNVSVVAWPFNSSAAVEPNAPCLPPQSSVSVQRTPLLQPPPLPYDRSP